MKFWCVLFNSKCKLVPNHWIFTFDHFWLCIFKRRLGYNFPFNRFFFIRKRKKNHFVSKFPVRILHGSLILVLCVYRSVIIKPNEWKGNERHFKVELRCDKLKPKETEILIIYYVQRKRKEWIILTIGKRERATWLICA